MTILHGKFEPDRAVVAAIGRRKVLAFAGIGDPEKFFATLTTAGIDVAARASFPDHHRYSAAEAKDLIGRAQKESLMLVTTEKDLMRLTGDPQLAALADRANALPVRLAIEEQDQFGQMILQAVKRRRSQNLTG
jgi:tetraacyldisaccharide 4'-kinase